MRARVSDTIGVLVVRDSVENKKIKNHDYDDDRGVDVFSENNRNVTGVNRV